MPGSGRFRYDAPMTDVKLPPVLAGTRIHLVGAKGTGMAALAEILAASGARLSGSDVADRFYTDEILASIGLELSIGFDGAHVPEDTALVIHSAAYAPDRNPELVEARRRGIPIMVYPEALGELSRRFDASGIAGVHGKTTTTALAGSLAAALHLPSTTLAGSAVSSFGGKSTLILGSRYLIAETCEYRRHFLHFSPRRIVLTSVESDHQDYYPSYDDIFSAFVEYCRLLPPGGELIYCADDPGAAAVAAAITAERADLSLVPYGRSAAGRYRLIAYETGKGCARFRLAGFAEPFELHVPGEHIALDATAALALAVSLYATDRTKGAAPASAAAPAVAELAALRAALADFRGSKRRSEILGEAGGILFMDDYAHHPTALRETIRGIKAFWPDRRIIVDFMSHTYSRTKALFDDFAASFDDADALVLHKIYASAREAPDPATSGRALYELARARRNARGKSCTSYYEEPLEALEPLARELRPGDLFLTMGAGDNWKLGVALLERFTAKGAPR